MTGLCGLEPKVRNTGGCPRQAGHDGECYWWLAWEDGEGWRVIVYSGKPTGRRKRCKGRFTEKPDVRDVAHLLHVLSPLKKQEVARRTPDSEPPPSDPDPFRLTPDGGKLVLVVDRV